MDEIKCKECGRIFEPILNGQIKCVDCIMQNEPAKLRTKSNSKEEPAWVEWFIYNWRCIREYAGTITK